MKLGDVIRVTTGNHAGQVGRVICVFRGWVTFRRADSVGVIERVEFVEVVDVFS